MNVGFTLAHRCARDDWKWPKYWVMWQHLIWEAAYEDNGKLKRGQVIMSERNLARACGETRDKVRWFLKRCEEEGDITRNHNHGHTPGSNPVYNPAPWLITIVKYDDYQLDENGHTPGYTPHNTPLLRERSKRSTKKKNKNPRSSERVPSDHQKIFDFFVQERRKAIGVEDWNPTNGAMMGKNIKQLLKQYSVDQILQMIGNYLSDPRMSGRSWPWTLFFNDPIQWMEARASPSLQSDWRKRFLEKEGS